MQHQPLDISIIGGGMITHDLILPSVYHLQREGVAGAIRVSALNSAPLAELKNSEDICRPFPGQDFEAFPSIEEDPDRLFPDLYRDMLKAMPPRQVVIVAVPDQFHYDMVMAALEHDQHVLCVKPLVLRYEQTAEIERLAMKKGLFVGVEYHKRFDRRSLMARRHYRRGDLGEFKIGEAKMIEPYFYRHSNFQNWFTCDKTDPFVYVGCHYVDLVYFITGLKPIAVSVNGIKGKFPNGNEGYLWSHGKVRYENGALLSVLDGLGYPDEAAGSNDQCLVMFGETADRGTLVAHDDQFRGIEYSYAGPIGCAGSRFNYVNPDFFRLVPWEGKGDKPVGYGYDSIAATLTSAWRLENRVRGMPAAESLAERQAFIRETDEQGIIATPANSYINELVVEAARLSIEQDGCWADITYGDQPRVALRA